MTVCLAGSCGARTGVSIPAADAGADAPSGRCSGAWVAAPVPLAGEVVALAGRGDDGPYAIVSHAERRPGTFDRWLDGAVLRRTGDRWSVLARSAAGDELGRFTSLVVRADGSLDVGTDLRDRDGVATRGAAILRFEGSTPERAWTDPEASVFHLRELGSGEVVAFGCRLAFGICSTAGLVVRRTADGWRAETTGGIDLQDGWGESADDFYAVGWPSVVLRYQRGVPRVLDEGIAGRHFVAWPAGGGVFVGGSSGFLRYTGDVAAPVRAGLGELAYGVSVVGEVAFVAGSRAARTAPLLLRQTGDDFVELPLPPSAATGEAAGAIWARDECELWLTIDGRVYQRR
jgi:hypothetical protein